MDSKKNFFDELTEKNKNLSLNNEYKEDTPMKINLKTMTNTEVKGVAMTELENIDKRVEYISILINPEQIEDMKELVKLGIEDNELDDKEQESEKYLRTEILEMKTMEIRLKNKADRLFDDDTKK
jgi:uncharacterized membrane protein